MQDATTLPPQAITARLPAGLKSEAEAYAAGLGVSLNALIAVALRDYLDARQRPISPPQAVSLPPVVVPPTPAPPAPLLPPPGGSVEKSGQPAYRKPKGGSGEPCPCGAKKPPYFDYPLKWRECHGKAV